ncbi:hypothetical protein CMMCAS04_14990 [Clavibacter michiganensis subsp. michiganensis]|nr:hypothetical protein CMMCAS04_14990 [Clavibacter michiganensis subsp. michiganensis]
MDAVVGGAGRGRRGREGPAVGARDAAHGDDERGDQEDRDGHDEGAAMAVGERPDPVAHASRDPGGGRA